MLRTYFMQQWFNLSDRGVEEAFYESATPRRFAGVELGVAPAPDETTVPRSDICWKSTIWAGW
jgi:IS5 family transposase